MPDPNVKQGAMLGFKVGDQSKIDQMLANPTKYPAVHGCFYLTNDSHRLYIGNEDLTLSAVNEGIQTVTWSELQTIAGSLTTAAAKEAMRGRFFYATKNPGSENDDEAPGNVLCVYDGSKWVQLNNNTDTYADGNTFAVSEASGVVTVTDTIHKSDDTTLPASFTVTGTNGITVSGTGTAITFEGDTYTLSAGAGSVANQAQIKLDSSKTANDSAVTLIGGTNVTITQSGNNITVESKDIHTKAVAITNDSTAGFQVSVTDTDDVKYDSNIIDPTITVKDANKAAIAGVHFVNGVAALDVYSTDAIDQKMKAFDAMTYKGTLGTNGTGATSISVNADTKAATITNASGNVPVSIGDTFLLNQDTTIDGVTYKAGSLIIVRALDGKSENAQTGIIAVGDYGVDIVAENWYSDTTYKITSTTKGIKLHASTDSDVGGLIVTEGANNDHILVTETSETENGGVLKTLTVTHKDVTRSNTTGTAVTQANRNTMAIPAITGVTTDAKGHVTGVQTTTFTATDTNGTLTSMSASTSAASNVGTVTVGAVFTHSDDTTDTPSTSFAVSSDNLTVTNTAASGSTPAGLAINMVWGSF